MAKQKVADQRRTLRIKAHQLRELGVAHVRLSMFVEAKEEDKEEQLRQADLCFERADRYEDAARKLKSLAALR